MSGAGERELRALVELLRGLPRPAAPPELALRLRASFVAGFEGAGDGPWAAQEKSFEERLRQAFDQGAPPARSRAALRAAFVAGASARKQQGPDPLALARRADTATARATEPGAADGRPRRRARPRVLGFREPGDAWWGAVAAASALALAWLVWDAADRTREGTDSVVASLPARTEPDAPVREGRTASTAALEPLPLGVRVESGERTLTFALGPRYRLELRPGTVVRAATAPRGGEPLLALLAGELLVCGLAEGEDLSIETPHGVYKLGEAVASLMVDERTGTCLCVSRGIVVALAPAPEAAPTRVPAGHTLFRFADARPAALGRSGGAEGVLGTYAGEHLRALESFTRRMDA